MNYFYKNDVILSETCLKSLSTMIQESIEVELSHREAIELYLNLNKIPYIIEEITAKTCTECSYCVNLNYLSYLECRACKKKSCINHNLLCKCMPKNVLLYYRYHDLKEFKSKKL